VRADLATRGRPSAKLVRSSRHPIGAIPPCRPEHLAARETGAPTPECAAWLFPSSGILTPGADWGPPAGASSPLATGTAGMRKRRSPDTIRSCLGTWCHPAFPARGISCHKWGFGETSDQPGRPSGPDGRTAARNRQAGQRPRSFPGFCNSGQEILFRDTGFHYSGTILQDLREPFYVSAGTGAGRQTPKSANRRV
jgi:hypothetical protein